MKLLSFHAVCFLMLDVGIRGQNTEKFSEEVHLSSG